MKINGNESSNQLYDRKQYIHLEDMSLAEEAIVHKFLYLMIKMDNSKMEKEIDLLIFKHK